MVQRWKFTELADAGTSWTVPINPYEMTSPIPPKNITSRHTTATNGQAIIFEGSPAPHSWSFKGAILGFEHFLELQRWFEKKQRVLLDDHFGRRFTIYITSFDPIPKRRRNRYWSHDYSVEALTLKYQSASELEAAVATLVGTDT